MHILYVWPCFFLATVTTGLTTHQSTAKKPAYTHRFNKTTLHEIRVEPRLLSRTYAIVQEIAALFRSTHLINIHKSL
jgi:hypothetical protein